METAVSTAASAATVRTLHGITADGSRMMFNFTAMQFEPVGTPTKDHAYDGGPMMRMCAEVNAEVMCHKFVALQSVTE